MIEGIMTAVLAPSVLLAAIGDWVTWIIVAVVMLVSFINQLLSDGAKKKPPQMPRRPSGGGANPGGGQKSLLDEVERFLQEARNQTSQSHQRPPQQQPQQQQPRPQQRMSTSLPSQQRPPQQQSKKKQRREQQQQRREQQQPQRLVTSERGRLQPEADAYVETGGGELSRLGGQHLPASRFDERAERLSHLQQTVEADIGGHVQHAFDHKIGSLSSESASPAAAAGAGGEVVSPAQQLVALLGDPMGVRNAVLLREILEPPTHRW